MFEQVEFMIDQGPVELTHAIRVPEKVRTRIGEVFSGSIGDIVRYFDLFHLRPIDGMRTEIAWQRGHVKGLLASAFLPCNAWLACARTRRARRCSFRPRKIANAKNVARVGFEPTAKGL
jgi:hypothetical protein